MLKLIDTTTSNESGRAERELAFSPRFEKFIRKNYNINELKTTNPEILGDKYNLKGVVYGNYLSQEERYFYTYKTFKQIELLSKLKGSKNIGNGKLILSIGAHGVGGNVNAHFSPSLELINLARGRKADFNNFMKGENSFVHEYGHYIDFWQGHHNDKNLNFNFASENQKPNAPFKTLLFSNPTNEVLTDQDYRNIIKNSKYLVSNIEVFARLFEASITHYVYQYAKTYIPFFNRSYDEAIYYPKKKIISHGYDKKMIKILKNSF